MSKIIKYPFLKIFDLVHSCMTLHFNQDDGMALCDTVFGVTHVASYAVVYTCLFFERQPMEIGIPDKSDAPMFPGV